MNTKRLLVIFVLFALLIATTSVAFASSDMDDANDDSDFIDVDIPNEEYDDLDYLDDSNDLDDDEDWDDDSDDLDDDEDWDDDSDDWDDDEDWDDDSDDWDDDEDWDDDLEDETYSYETVACVLGCAFNPFMEIADLSLGDSHKSVSKSIDQSQIPLGNENETNVNTNDGNDTITTSSDNDWGIIGLIIALLLSIILLI